MSTPKTNTGPSDAAAGDEDGAILHAAAIAAHDNDPLEPNTSSEVTWNDLRIAWSWIVWIVSFPWDQSYWRWRWRKWVRLAGAARQTTCQPTPGDAPPTTFRQRVKLACAPSVPDPDLF